MNRYRISLYIISQEIFAFSLLTYLLLLLVEMIKNDTVNFFFNPHMVLPIIFISGFLAVITYHKESSKEPQKFSLITKIIVCFLVVIGGSLFVLVMTEAMGVISFILTILVALILLIFSLLLFVS